MGILSNRISLQELQPGDHIYSWRAAYTYAHHGIYIGGGKVIHFTRGQDEELGTGTFVDRFILSSRSSSTSQAPCEKCGVREDSKGVLLSCLNCFLSGGPLYRFEYSENTATFLAKARGGTCTLAKSDLPETVIYRAKYLLENGFGCYCIFYNNCEDFAMYCKTGLLVVEGNRLAGSGQAVSFLGVPLAAVVSSPVQLILAEPWGMVAATAGVYCASRYLADLGVRKDAVKVAVEDLVAKLIAQSSSKQ